MDYLTTQSFFQPGALIAGRYEAVCTLGTGGMGSVIKVIDRALEDEVIALKILYPHHVQDKTVFARFRNEVLIARRLAHPNIVRIYDFGQAGGGYYFVTMEYVSGGSLTRFIYEQRRESMVFSEIVRMLLEVAHGMDHAHRIGVIHRDLKPDNILLTDRAEVKITDFGLARTLYVDQGFTDTGEAVGTPYYMSPEQLRGEKVDGRSDIYSFGLIAFEMVVGRRAFYEENYHQLAVQHFMEPLPDFATKESGIPPWFEKIVKKCAEKKPNNRYQSFAELIDVLGSQLEKIDAGSRMRRAPAVLSLYAPTVRPGRRRSSLGFLAGMVAGMVLVGAGVFALRIPEIRGKALGMMANIESALPASSWGSSWNAAEAVDPKEFFAKVSQGDLTSVKTMLAAGMSVSEMGERNETALHVALKNEQYKMASLLLEHAAEINAKNEDGVTPLLLVAQAKPSAQNLRMAQELLKHGALPYEWDNNRRTAFMYAAESGNLPILQALVGASANRLGETALFTVQDKDLRTSLMYAVKNEQVAVVRYLLSLFESQRFDIGLMLQDHEGKNALFFAAALEDDTITELLLNAGMDAKVRDLEGKRAIDYAKLKNRKLLAPKSK